MDSIKILSWNVCFGCVLSSEKSVNDRSALHLAMKCKAEREASGTNVCMNNIIKHISKTKYDFIGLQESSNSYFRFKIKNLDVGYVPLSCIVETGVGSGEYAVITTVYDESRFNRLYAKIGNLTPGRDARPYQILFFEEKYTAYKYIIINIHNWHNDSPDAKDQLSFALSNNLNMVQDLRRDHEINILVNQERYPNIDITDYIRSNNKTFNVIMMGDFNDAYGINYWRGFKPFSQINFLDDTYYLKNLQLSTSGVEPPKTCCVGEHRLRINNLSESKVGDYILIDTTKLSFNTPGSNPNKIPSPDEFNFDANINPTSDHLPVEASIIVSEIKTTISNIIPEDSIDYQFNVKGINNFTDFYLLINKTIKTIIEILFRRIKEDNLIYFGKPALMYYINQINIKKNNYMNFDMSVINDPADVKGITDLLTDISSELNNEILKFNYKYFLFNLLKRANLITVDEKEYYIGNNLFKFSKYKNYYYLCIQLKLREDLFIDKTFNNISSYEEINEICYPISKVKYDSHDTNTIDTDVDNLNKNLLLTKNESNLYVPNLAILLYNLINYDPDYSVDLIKKNNNEEIKLLSNINNYKYSCLQKLKLNIEETTDWFESILEMLVLKVHNYHNNYLNIDGIDVYNCTYYIFLDTIINNIKKNINFELQKRIAGCLMYSSPNPDLSNLLKDGNESEPNYHNNPVLVKYTSLINDYDKQRVIRAYCGPFYSKINELLYDSLLGIKNRSVNEQQTRQQIDTIDKIFKDYHNNPYVAEYNENLNDSFFLYRFQNYCCFDSDNSNFLNIPTLNTNDIIHFPSYLSTSFSKNYMFDQFLNYNSYLLKIQIKKDSKNYIIIGSYGVLGEHEILLNRGLYYRVITITNTIVKTGMDDIMEIPTIELELIENYELFKQGFTIQLINVDPLTLLKDNHSVICPVKQTKIITLLDIYEAPLIKDSADMIPLGFLGAGGNAEVLFFELMDKIFAVKFEPVFYKLNHLGEKEYKLYDILTDTVSPDINYHLTIESLSNFEYPEYLNFANREINELLCMKLCNDIIDMGISPCLPYLYKYYLCDNCKTSKNLNFKKYLLDKYNEPILQNLVEYNSDYCFLLLSKKYSKTLINVQHKITDDDIKYIYAFHVLHGLYTMDYYYNIIHTDLHNKNVLFDGFRENVNITDEYDIFDIIIDGQYERFYVPFINSYAIVWDWGRASAYLNETTYNKIIRSVKGAVLDYFGTIYHTVFNLPDWKPEWVRNPINMMLYKRHYVEFFKLFDKFKVEPAKYTIKNVYTFRNSADFKPDMYSQRFLSNLIFPVELPEQIGGNDVVVDKIYSDIPMLDKPYDAPIYHKRTPLPMIKKLKSKPIAKDYVVEIIEDREKPNFTELPAIIPVIKKVKINNINVKLSQAIMYPIEPPKNPEEELDAFGKLSVKLNDVIFPDHDSNYLYL